MRVGTDIAEFEQSLEAGLTAAEIVILRTRPLFWTAEVGTTLGPATLPILGEKPFRVEAVDGRLLTTDSPTEALIYVGAGAAEKLRGMTLLGTLVRTGSIAILLRPDGE